MRLLVAEDENDLALTLRRALEEEGFAIDLACDGEDGLFKAREISYDAIILDLMLPRLDGWAVLQALRRGGTRTPVLILTARDAIEDKVRGLELGADDYLTKPFGVRELVARAAALTRRARGALTTAQGDSKPLNVHGVELDPSRRAVRVRGNPVEVTRQEFNLLYLLASHPGIVFTRDRLLSRVWQGQSFVTGRSVDTLVKRLRKKIEADPAEPQLIITVWGDGYKFSDLQA